MASGQVHSVLFEGSEVYEYGTTDNLQFYTTTYGDPASGYAPSTSAAYYPPQNVQTYPNAGYHPGGTGSFWSAFGTGGFADEPPLLEELGINFGHIKSKSLAVLNPLRTVDKNIMDDTDLAGPLLFCLIFGVSLLLTGKVHFGYIYGVAVLGWLSIYSILNLMSESGLDGYRTASVLGYCLLPLVILSLIGVMVPLSGPIGLIASGLAIGWCTYSSSTMFVTVLQMSEQRLLVGYPVGMLYDIQRQLRHPTPVMTFDLSYGIQLYVGQLQLMVGQLHPYPIQYMGQIAETIISIYPLPNSVFPRGTIHGGGETVSKATSAGRKIDLQITHRDKNQGKNVELSHSRRITSTKLINDCSKCLRTNKSVLD
ncbi:2160_t:CDS:2 [Ambispora leptoticha]|uniref:Protein YIP n=1 Tax=Ambispora leptoticha TaxID=144679 RepID=A0A9N8V7E1_9GLOM|nr:2160_t:CDS:2 [Ambispora leptoticha]